MENEDVLGKRSVDERWSTQWPRSEWKHTTRSKRKWSNAFYTMQSRQARPVQGSGACLLACLSAGEHGQSDRSVWIGRSVKISDLLGITPVLVLSLLVDAAGFGWPGASLLDLRRRFLAPVGIIQLATSKQCQVNLWSALQVETGNPGFFLNSGTGNPPRLSH